MTHDPDANITMPHGTEGFVIGTSVHDVDLHMGIISGHVYTQSYLKQAVSEAVAAERERCASIADIMGVPDVSYAIKASP